MAIQAAARAHESVIDCGRLECGFGACADNPIVYELLKRT
ncbi:hypothetical protein ACVIW0_004408 [Bradyrhizobium sp. USDA 4454]